MDEATVTPQSGTSESRSRRAAARRALVRLAACLAAVVTLLAAACRKEQSAPPPSGPVPVNVVEAIEREVTEWDEFTGRVGAVEAVDIRARVSGYLQEIAFDAGDLVEKGELLFVIDPRPYQADLDSAAAALEQAEARLKLAQADFNRAEVLRKKGVLAAEEFDQKLAALRETEASLDVAKAAVETAKLHLGFTRIEAPITGRVADARITVGNLIQAGAGEAGILTTIVSVDPVYIYLDADENAVLEFMEERSRGERKTAQEEKIPVYAQMANEEGFPHEGYLDFVDNRLDPETGTLRLRGVFKSWDPLLVPGFFVRARIASGPKSPAVLLPDEVISSQQGIKYVYVVKPDHTIERRNLETGGLHEGQRIVRSGLKAGELVVSTRLQILRPGMPVQPVPEQRDERAPAQSAAPAENVAPK